MRGKGAGRREEEENVTRSVTRSFLEPPGGDGQMDIGPVS